MKINNKEFKNKINDLASDAKQMLTAKGARMSMTAAFAVAFCCAGVGFIAALFIVNLLMYCGAVIPDPAVYAILAAVLYLFLAPAVAAIRNNAAAVCDGRETDPSELFIAFASLKNIASAYLGALIGALRFAVAILLFFVPDIVEIVFKLKSEDGASSPILIPIGIASIAASVIWIFVTGRMYRVSHYIWSKKMSPARALGASLKTRHVSRPLTGDDWLGALISFSTCFTYYIFAAGPLYAVKYELYCRREEQLIEETKIIKPRKEGQRS